MAVQTICSLLEQEEETTSPKVKLKTCLLVEKEKKEKEQEEKEKEDVKDEGTDRLQQLLNSSLQVCILS